MHPQLFSHISTLNACLKHDLGHGKWPYLKGHLIKEKQYSSLVSYIC